MMRRFVANSENLLFRVAGMLCLWGLAAGCGGPAETSPAGTLGVGNSLGAQADFRSEGEAVGENAVAQVPKTSAGKSGVTETGEDWPEFLGPTWDGKSIETRLLKKWPQNGPPLLWKIKIGEGYSAPSVRGNQLVLFHRPQTGRFPGEKEVVACLAADTGEEIWKQEYTTDYVDPYGYNGGPRCTPLVTKVRCYTFGAEGVLTCWNLADGKQIWQRKTAEEFRIPPAFFGVGSSPILVNGKLIVMVGGHPKSGVVAFDPATGKTLWESVGPESFPAPQIRIQRDRPPAKLASYAAPLAATIHGQQHILCFMRPGLVSLDPDSGEVNFSYWFRSELHDSVNAARPVVVGDQIFLSAAYETGAVLLRVRSDGKGVDEVWKDVDAMQTHWSTTIEHDGFLYGFSGRHMVPSSFRCIALKTGKLQWATAEPEADDFADPKDGRGKKEPKYFGRGSAIMADGRFIVLGETGTLALVEVDPRAYREVSRIRFPEAGYPSWTAPVLSRGRLFLSVAREGSDQFGRHTYEYHLLCLDLRQK